MLTHLPDEIVIPIFELCRDLYRKDLKEWHRLEATRHLWALSHINRRFRSLVLQTPALWSVITVCVDGWGQAKILPNTASRLSRQVELSGDHKLEVEIQLDGSDGTHELFLIVYQVRNRWSSATLYIPSTWWPPVLRTHPFPILRTLTARTPLRNVITGPTGEPVELPPVDGGEPHNEIFPKLEKFAMWEQVAWFCYKLETIPWSQIVKHEYQGVIWDVLEKFTRLAMIQDVSLICTANQPGFAIAIYTQNLRDVRLLLPGVRTLRLLDRDDTFTPTILQHLTLPSLSCIQLSEMNGPLVKALAEFISRSNCKIEAFIADFPTLDTASFIEVLKLFEHLRFLDFTFSFVLEQEDRSTIVETLCDQASCLPHLEVVVARHGQLEAQNIYRVLRACSRKWKEAHFKQCTFNRPTEEVLVEFHRIRKETGMLITWT